MLARARQQNKVCGVHRGQQGICNGLERKLRLFATHTPSPTHCSLVLLKVKVNFLRK